jgi:hypothetical protein
LRVGVDTRHLIQNSLETEKKKALSSSRQGGETSKVKRRDSSDADVNDGHGDGPGVARAHEQPGAGVLVHAPPQPRRLLDNRRVRRVRGKRVALTPGCQIRLPHHTVISCLRLFCYNFCSCALLECFCPYALLGLSLPEGVRMVTWTYWVSSIERVLTHNNTVVKSANPAWCAGRITRCGTCSRR